MLQHFAVREPDLVVLDLRLDQEDGLDLLREMRADCDVPVIIITGDDAPETRARSLALGANCYLCKPIDEGTLLAAITAVSGSPQNAETPRS